MNTCYTRCTVMKTQLRILTIIIALSMIVASCGRKDAPQADNPQAKKKGYHRSQVQGYLKNGKKDGNRSLSGN